VYSIIYEKGRKVFGILCSFSVLFYESCSIYIDKGIENGKLLCNDLPAFVLNMCYTYRIYLKMDFVQLYIIIGS